jgi:glycosyltransferase involved in cell wall biosynthesis
MNVSPLVSIGIVCYNSESYIDLAIKSALGIKYANIEVIVCDDNSSDNTWQIIETYKCNKLKAFQNDQNIGEYSNREKCIHLSSGKYFIFIDGDDYIYPHGISFLVNMMEKFSTCPMALMHKPRIDVIYPIISTPREFILGEFFGDGFNKLSFANIFFKSVELKKNLPFPKGIINGDDFLRYKICVTHNILIVNDSLTWWRQTPNQASSQIRLNINAIKKHLLLKKELLINFNSFLSPYEIKEAEKNIHIEIARIFKMLLKKGKINILLEFIQEFGISFRYLFSKPIRKKVFPNHSPSNPKMLPLEQNPYYNSTT